MISSPLPLSTRQSVSQGPWVIVTLTGSFVDQSLVFIFKIKTGIAFELKVGRKKPLQPRVIEGQAEGNAEVTSDKSLLQNSGLL